MKSVFFRLIIILLAFLFILTSLSPVLAQETIPIPGDTQNLFRNPDIPVSGENIFSQGNVTKSTTITTTYPSKYYNIDSNGKVTKHIFANGVEIATIEGTGSEATVKYIHTDNLGSTNVVTYENGAVVETIDYLPFGTARIDQKTTSFSDQRKYIGQEYDETTGLNYLNARYYDLSTGKFLSQDPVFWNFDSKLNQFLSDPQTQNSYSYAKNNPITFSDPEGKWYKEYLTGKQSWASFTGEVGEATQYMSNGWQTAMEHPIIAGATIGVLGGTTALGVSYLSGAGLVIDNLATGQLISNVGIQAIGVRNNIQSALQNFEVTKLLKDVFRSQDKIGGGTIEALKRQIATGELIGGKDHIIKSTEIVNRISNIQNTQQLNKIEQKGIQTISNIIQKLLSNTRK